MRAHIVSTVLVLAIAGCAESVPPQELVNARSAYDQTSHGQAGQLAPADVHSAHEALAQAEASFDDHGDTQATRDLAYVAQRRAQLADARAQILSLRSDAASSQSQLEALREQQVRTTSAELSSEQQALATAEQQRADAERRARQASADLARIASVKQEPRGMVISIPGSVLFATAKSDLLPAAQAKLSQVVEALTREDPDSKLLVEGYTDSQGALAYNEELSQRRAEAVASYLTAHGIAPDRVTSKGMGPANPIADNATSEGRADNRRVEIVVEPKGTPSTEITH